MIKPYGIYLLVKMLEVEKKKGSLLMVNEEQPAIVACELIDVGHDVEDEFHPSQTLYFRRYELRDCVDKEQNLYIVSTENVLGYEV